MLVRLVLKNINLKLKREPLHNLQRLSFYRLPGIRKTIRSLPWLSQAINHRLMLQRCQRPLPWLII